MLLAQQQHYIDRDLKQIEFLIFGNHCIYLVLNNINSKLIESHPEANLQNRAVRINFFSTMCYLLDDHSIGIRISPEVAVFPSKPVA